MKSFSFSGIRTALPPLPRYLERHKEIRALGLNIDRKVMSLDFDRTL
jgi:hypothetical protein